MLPGVGLRCPTLSRVRVALGIMRLKGMLKFLRTSILIMQILRLGMFSISCWRGSAMLQSSSRVVRLMQLLFLLVIGGCSTQQSQPVAAEAVYLADRSSLARYRQRLEGGYDKPAGLAVELSSDDPYSNGGYVLDGFCGEASRVAMLGDGGLYKLPLVSGSRFRFRYLALISIQSTLKPFAYPSVLTQDLVTYDLKNDSRDICIRTVQQGQVGQLLSNELRVSRLDIERALNGGIRPLPSGLRTQ